MGDCFDVPENWTADGFIDFSKLDYSKLRLNRAAKPPWEITVKTLVVIFIVLLGIFGNYLVIHVVFRFKQSRNCTNLFICNMAVADFLSIILCAWAALVTNLVQNYVLGAWYCKFESFTKLACLLASVFSLITISFDRLLVVINPLSSHLTTTRAYIYMFFIWTAAIIISIPLYIGKEFHDRQWCDAREAWCIEDPDFTLYWVLILAILVYVPLILMTLVYVVIIVKMRMYERRVGTENSSTRFKYRRKIIKMLFLYLMSSIICWLPLQITVYYRYYKNYDDYRDGLWRSEAQFWSHIFITINSTLNPIIYGLSNESFRRHILAIHPKLCFILGRQSRAFSPRVTPITTPPIDINIIPLRRSTLTTSQQRSANGSGLNLNTLSSNNLNFPFIPNRILCRREFQR